MKKEKLEQLLVGENDHLQKLNNIVLEAIEEEKLLSQKIFEFEEKDISFGNRVADSIAGFGGSWYFILSFILFMTVWMVLNLVVKKPLDPFPFILLNLFLSAIAAIQAPVIMMSQNRKEAKDRQRSNNDYIINLKAEIEVRNLHQKMDLLISEQMKTLFEIQKVQMDLMQEIKLSLKRS
ncbi:MAG: DUF1003 domain-containing protein [Bacteroidota bacterium]